jgi:hypothetical protein
MMRTRSRLYPAVFYRDFLLQRGEFSLWRDEFGLRRGEFDLQRGEFGLRRDEFSLQRGEFGLRRDTTLPLDETLPSGYYILEALTHFAYLYI